METPTKSSVTMPEMLLMAPEENSSPTDSRSLVSRVMSLPSGIESKTVSGSRCTWAKSFCRKSRVTSAPRRASKKVWRYRTPINARTASA